MRKLAEEVILAAKARDMRIALAESCTGGLVTGALTEVPGASAVLDRGFVTYSYPSKTDLVGVPEEMLRQHGAVSEPVARAMAEGALVRSEADLVVAITGVAGPGGSEEKPEGLVYFACATQEATLHLCKEFGPLGRANIREAAVKTALRLLLDALS